MPHKQTPLAKLTRPRGDGLVVRERLFTSLDQARRHAAVWISAPAGAGKTSLLASYLETRKLPCLWYQVDAGDTDLATFFHYLGRAAKALAPRQKPLPSLTPEYLPGLETFVRRYFRLLFGRFGPPFALVLDNFHEACTTPSLPQAIAHGLSEVPQGTSVVLISRKELPSPLARHGLDATVIGWDDLKLTGDEALAFARQHGVKNHDPVALQPVVEAAQGWAAGLVLLSRAQAEGHALSSVERQPSKELYDYFMQEVFATIPAKNQDMLLKTALLPGVTAEAARQLTGREQVPKVLAELHRDRFFVDRHSRSAAVYVYHPLFREFLLERAREVYPPRRLARIKQRAAQVLQHSGQAEAAVELLIDIKVWDEAVPLMLQQAPALLEQGRNATLDGWIDSLPRARREGEPWLLYWQGISRMPFSPPESRLSLEPAFAQFKVQGEVSGMYLALGAVLSSYFFEWGDVTPVDRWITELEQLRERHPDFPSLEVEAQVAAGMMALLLRCPQHRLVRKFTERAVPLMRLCPEPRQKCAVASPAILYSHWSGDFTRAGSLLTELMPYRESRQLSPLDTITLNIMEAIHAYQCAAHDAAFAAIGEASRIAHVSGVHILDVQIYTQAAITALSAGDSKRATAFLEHVPPILDPTRRSDAGIFRLAELGNALTQDEFSISARKAHEMIVRELQDTGTVFALAVARLSLGQLQIELGEHSAAKRELVQVKAFAQEMPSAILQFQALIAEANSFFLTGDEDIALDLLRQALALGRERGYRNCHPWWQPKVMSRLFAKALEAGIEVEYVREFIRVRDLKPPSPDVEHWPWPIRIYSLGRFAAVIEEEPLRFPAKAQKKPLELLKAILAHGGRSVDQHALMDALWPDLDGSAARNALDLALHRLRKLLRRPDALELQEGKLALNPGVVWADAWAFERLCGAVERSKSQRLLQPAPTVLAERLLRLYPGAFLAGEDAPWAITTRERLRSKFQRNVTLLGRELTRKSAWNEATVLYRRAIELDPLAEEFHRALMESYRAQDRIAEALEAYRRCRHILSVTLGVEPSPQTQAIYRSLKRP